LPSFTPGTPLTSSARPTTTWFRFRRLMIKKRGRNL
jgi:hypothetical protein